MNLKPLLFSLLFLLLLPIVHSASTQQYNKILLSPYYNTFGSSSQNISMTLNVNPPDNLKTVVSAILNFEVFSSNTYYVYVNNQTCLTNNFTASAGQGQALISYDCGNIITKAGNYTVQIRPSANNLGTFFGWLDLTYMNNPISISGGGTEYQAGNSARIFARLLDSNSVPVNLGACNATIYYPNNTKFVTSTPMTFLEKGVYYYDFTTPSVTGNYITIFDCVFPSSIFTYNNTGIPTLSAGNFYSSTFPFDDTNNVTINSAYMNYSKTGGTTSITFNGQTIASGLGNGEFKINLYPGNFTLGDEQSYVITSTGGTTTSNWISIYVNYTYNNPLTTIRGQEEVHVNPAYQVIANNTDVLLAIANMNNTLIQNTSTLWTQAFNHDLNLNNTRQNLTTQITNLNTSIWVGLVSIENQLATVLVNLASVNNTLIASNQSLSNQLVTIYNNITNVNNNILSMNTSLSNGQSQILGNQTIILQNLTTISNQIVNTNSTIHSQLDSISSQIALMNSTMLSKFSYLDTNMAANFTYTNNLITSMNSSLSNLILAINTSIINKLITLDSEVTSVNDTVKLGFNNLQSNITTIRNDISSLNGNLTAINASLSNMILDNKNTILSVNQTINNKLDVIQQNLTTSLVYLNQINNTVNNLNVTAVVDLSLVYGNFTYIANKIDNVSTLVYNSNQSIMNELSTVRSDIATLSLNMAANFTYTNNLILALNTSMFSQFSSMQASLSNIKNDIGNLSSNMASNFTYTNSQITTLSNNLASNFTALNNSITSVSNSLLSMNQSLGNMITSVNNTVLATNQSIMNKLTILESNVSTALTYLSQINSTVNNISVDLTPVMLAITSVNDTVLAVNSSIFTKLVGIQNEITSVNDTVKSINGTLSSQISSINVSLSNQISNLNTSVSSLHSDLLSVNSTLYNAIVSVNNSVILTNTSLSNQLSSVKTDLNNVLGNLTQIESTLSSLNTSIISVNNTVLATNSSLWSGISNIQSSLVEINSTLQALNVTVDLSQVYSNLTYIQSQVSNVSSLVSATNSSIMGQLFILNNDMNNNFTYTNGLITATNTSIMSYLQGLPALVWSYGNRTLTAFNFLVDLSVSSLNAILNPMATNFTYTNSKIDNVNQTLYSLNTTFFTELQNVQYGLQSVNDTVKDVNASISNQITTVYNHIDDVLNDVASMNNSLLSINASTMNKLNEIQSEIISVNNTLIDVNMTLPDDIWIFPYRNLTYYPSVSPNITVNTTINITVNSTTVDPALIWSYAYRNLTFYPQGLNASDVWNYATRNLTSFDFTVNINSTDIMNSLSQIQSGLTSVNNTVKDVNTSLSNQITTVYDHVTSVINDVAYMNNTMIAINATTMAKLYAIQQEIASVNDTVKSLAITPADVWNYNFRNLTYFNASDVAYSVWNYDNRSLTEFNFVVTTNITSQLSDLMNAIVSVNNTVKNTNTSLSNQLTSVYNHIGDVLTEIANLNNTMLLINNTNTAMLLQIEQDIQGINTTDLILSVSQNMSSELNYTNQTILDAIAALNFSTLTANDVWSFQNRTLTGFNFTVNATCNTCNLTPVLDAIANMNDSMFAINTSTFTELGNIQDNIAIANNSIYAVNSSLSGQLSDVYNNIGTVINDVANVNNTIIAVNNTTMTKLYKIQDEITSVNDTVKAMNVSISDMYLNGTANITGTIENLTLITANDVWTNSIRTLTSAVNVSAGNITNVENVGTVNNAEASFADVRYAGATEYNSGETAQISYLFLNTVSGNPDAVNNGTCNVTVWYPNKTMWYNQTNMTFLTQSQGLYYLNIVPVTEGIYTTNAMCEESGLRGFGSSTFHVAPWANKIYFIPNDTAALVGNVSTNITANISDDLYFKMRDFIISWNNAADPTERSCIDNSTLRITHTYTMNVTGSTPANFTTYEDMACSLGCDSSTTPPSCKPASQVNIWIFLILTVLALLFMFMVPSKIVNILGAFIIIVLGGYVLIAGIDFVASVGLQGTVNSYTLSTTLTWAIGLIYIGLGLFRIAVAWAKLQGD